MMRLLAEGGGEPRGWLWQAGFLLRNAWRIDPALVVVELSIVAAAVAAVAWLIVRKAKAAKRGGFPVSPAPASRQDG